MKSHLFWVFIVVCLVDLVVFFLPVLSLCLLAAALFPKLALKFAKIFVEFYNQTYGTELQIVGEEK